MAQQYPHLVRGRIAQVQKHLGTARKNGYSRFMLIQQYPILVLHLRVIVLVQKHLGTLRTR
eukprot:740266-Rhodomonas_salina.1